MQNFIRTLGIERFKSIRSLSLDCKRINVFVGAPNVGKSNILEALALFGLTKPHISRGGLQDLVRFETVDNLFYDNRRDETCSVSVNEFSYRLSFDAQREKYLWFVGDTARLERFLSTLESTLPKSSLVEIEQGFHNQLHRMSEFYQRQKPILVPAFADFDRSGLIQTTNIFPSLIRKYIFTSQGKFEASFN